MINEHTSTTEHGDTSIGTFFDFSEDCGLDLCCKCSVVSFALISIWLHLNFFYIIYPIIGILAILGGSCILFNILTHIMLLL
jgi:hypothetical protein